MHNNPRPSLFCPWLSAAVLLAPGPWVTGQEPLYRHPVFELYPTLSEVEARVAESRQAEPDAYAAARVDFDLALRAPFAFDTPPPPRNRPVPHIPPKPIPSVPHDRAYYQRVLLDLRREPGAEANAAFLEAHLDDFSVEITPALRMVLLDTALNGWDDWTSWDTERLREYRERFPDIHRIAAVSLLSGIGHDDWNEAARAGNPAPHPEYLRYGRVFLELCMDESLSAELSERVWGSVSNLPSSPELLEFVIDVMQRGGPGSHLRHLHSVIGSLSNGLRTRGQREFWSKYLGSNDEVLRRMAVDWVGGAMKPLETDFDKATRSRVPNEAEIAANAPLLARLRVIAASDPRTEIRQLAARKIREYEDDSPPFSGIVDHSKPDQEPPQEEPPQP